MSIHPTMILVVRHAEKPADASNRNLSDSGRLRAIALAKYIPKTFGKPDFIFAAKVSKLSARPFETVEPLSKKINIPIDASFASRDCSRLAQTIASGTRFSATRILICWHHESIPKLMRALGAPHTAYPNPWPPTVFDLILKLEFSLGLPKVIQMIEPF